MNIAKAMGLANKGATNPGESFAVFLACSFTPLHLKTFLTAHLVERLPTRKISVDTGLYGDLISCLRQLDGGGFQAVAVVLEWEDLDPRLGFRSSQSCSASLSSDILQNATDRLDTLTGLLIHLSEKVGVSLSLPGLPLSQMVATPLARADPMTLALEEKLAKFGVVLANVANVRLVNRETLNRLSPPGQRHDLTSQLRWDFPYQIGHCSILAQLLSKLMIPGSAKKAIVTDLDGTMWRGTVGEDGVGNISWDLENGSHGHTIYQRMLTALADAGVLVAVASKNDPGLVQEALSRKDLVLDSGILFPIEANWGAKSQSLERILNTWNIGAESVVLIDDSELELAEVKQSFPDITCIQYPKEEAHMIQFLDHLRDLFGRAATTQEDHLRSRSVRSNLERAVSSKGATEDEFLSKAKATMVFRFNKPDQRMFELINKTNQFNINGLRIDESAWKRHLADPGSFILGVSYEDKFGPLGTIAVVMGAKDDVGARILTWVMSCRAFSRRIEYQILKTLFDTFGVKEIELKFIETERNGPIRDFIVSIGGDRATVPLTIQRHEFLSRCPKLFAKMVVE